jgi:hypothetical protein
MMMLLLLLQQLLLLLLQPPPPPPPPPPPLQHAFDHYVGPISNRATATFIAPGFTSHQIFLPRSVALQLALHSSSST